ncbi:HET-domain-containing protein [Cucurbitaria berberidis CBS 394.84]|uniref:HET-domain-containing protein n=1 Tax=Cucurbitaria berberidis CBS 394.84 TaxID=1168544 RepID=A0A9P4GS92_9PLEO|nr:HET-domain-containing protein [Cucurbitaria berberidis CBS 394.84]KAF1850392.1 HET-domain-containing protein [Cucurbitaria berberidis CBS 394.84]
MRLLNTSTLKIEEFLQRQVPEYVILSHTWEEEEVSFQDMQSGSAHAKKGYAKIKSCCKKAAEDGFLYCWIDTCCIDKTSSAELSESINSMYQWYKDSRICYAYLSDFNIDSGMSTDMSMVNQQGGLGSQRWFKRGWTLQELIAPTIVEFYDANWNEFGTRLSLREQLTQITGITKYILQGTRDALITCGVAVRMSWAAKRKTTRIEDEAYCLMGLFGVNMPLLYGEGSYAFRRLQEAIMRITEDYTLLAWSPKESFRPDVIISRGLLAHSLSDFAGFRAENQEQNPLMSHVWRPVDLSLNHSSLFPPCLDHVPPHLTSRGLRITLPVMVIDSGRQIYACLTLLYPPGQNPIHMLCVKLYHSATDEERYIREAGAPLVVLPRTASTNFEYKSIYVKQPPFLAGAPIWEPNIDDQSPALSLLLLKAQSNFSWPMMCNSRPFIDGDNIIQVRSGSQTFVSPIVPNSVAIAYLNPEVDHHQGNKLVHAYADLKQGFIHEIDTANSTIYFSPCDNTSRDGFIFEFEGQPKAAFDVRVNLRNVPSCWAMHCASPTYKQTEWRASARSAGHTLTDRIELNLEFEYDDTGQTQPQGQEKVRHVQATISIRRVANLQTPMDLKRFVLSVSLKDVSALHR